MLLDPGVSFFQELNQKRVLLKKAKHLRFVTDA